MIAVASVGPIRLLLELDTHSARDLSWGLLTCALKNQLVSVRHALLDHEVKRLLLLLALLL
jgi:hypothetical protein